MSLAFVVIGWFRHCEERSDEAIQSSLWLWITSLRSQLRCDSILLLHQRAARRFQRLERLVAGHGGEQLVVVPARLGFRGLLDLEQIHVVHHAAVLADAAVL